MIHYPSAIKHQMAIAFHWETVILKKDKYGPIKSFSLRDENAVNNEMLEIILSKDVFSTSWVEVDGVEYKAGLVVLDWTCQSYAKSMLLVEDHFFFVDKQAIHREF